MNDSDRDTAYRRFRDAVNMNAGKLERWLDSAQSKAVGQNSSDRRADQRSQQDRTDYDFFHGRRKRELFLDEEDGSGDDADVVAEKHAAQRRDGSGEIDKMPSGRLGLILHQSTSARSCPKMIAYS